MRMRLAQIWRLQKQNYRLVGEECNRCGNKLFPPQDVCPECHSGGPERSLFPNSQETSLVHRGGKGPEREG